MKTFKYIFMALLLGATLIFLSACSAQEMKQSAQDTVNQKVDQATQEVTDEIKKSAKDAVDKKVDSAVKSIENKIDPKLGEIRKNMEGVKDAALVYYNINNRLPVQNKIVSLFDKSFSQMKIHYTLSSDGKTATVSYVGKEYAKEKLPDISIDPSKQ